MRPFFDRCPVHLFTKSNLRIYPPSKEKGNLVARHTWHAIQDLINFNASLSEDWALAVLQICFVGMSMRIVTGWMEFLVDMTPFNVVLARCHGPHIWFVVPTPEGKLLWIIEHVQSFPLRGALALPLLVIFYLPELRWSSHGC